MSVLAEIASEVKVALLGDTGIQSQFLTGYDVRYDKLTGDEKMPYIVFSVQTMLDITQWPICDGQLSISIYDENEDGRVIENVAARIRAIFSRTRFKGNSCAWCRFFPIRTTSIPQDQDHRHKKEMVFSIRYWDKETTPVVT